VSLAAFISALHVAGMQPNGLEIAEVVWLAQHLDSASAFLAESERQQPMAQVDGYSAESPGPSSGPSSTEHVRLGTTKGAMEGPTRIRGHPAEIPGIPGLRQREEIRRALRPLRRYGASLHHYVIDEDATAAFIADTGLWTPVMRPAPERWFDVILAIDSSPSMRLWSPLIADLRTVLSETGAFRDIRTWEILRPVGRATARSPRELIDGAGRRLFLVVTDGAASSWHNGSATGTLAVWGKTGPVAILQLLPEQMWPRTGLPTAPVLITAPAPGTRNSQLRVERHHHLVPGISIPVLGVEPDALHAWAHLVAGSASTVRLAVTPTSGNRQPRSSLADLNEPGTAVERYRASASPQAYQLAVYLSAVPLTLPIMRLVHHVVVPPSPISALAEVILGGLISNTGDGNYEFLPGIRETLLKDLRRSELASVFAAVSGYITQNAGRSSHTFPAIAEYADGSVAADVQTFSWVPHVVAARLGLPDISSQVNKSASAPLRELGADPATGKPMVIMDGPVGPYVTDGEIIALLRGSDLALITDARAAELLAERRPARPPTGKRATPARQGARIVLVGPPGAGKGTQSHFLASHLAIPRISTGDIFRYNVTNQTELGAKAVEYMDRGDLVPDEVTVAMVRDRLAEDDAQAGFLLDGFPRNVPQAETLKKILAELDVKLTVVLELVVDENEVVRRLSGRRTCRQCQHIWHELYDPPTVDGVCDACGGELFQRDDDKEEVIRHRLEVYISQTSPLIVFYADEQILVGIDATGPVEEVTSRALGALEPYMPKPA
jgi:adenylate kinase